VVDFPLFEETENGQLTYMHMPFVAPLEEDIGLLSTQPRQVRATHYDLVLNGVELGSGSLRNHRSDVQVKILEILGYSEAQARERFGFMLEALDTVRRPMAALPSVSTGSVSCWPVVTVCVTLSPSPKHSVRKDLFMQSPNTVEPEQLRELGTAGTVKLSGRRQGCTVR
jgi:aspartyl-tRNA synthetase